MNEQDIINMLDAMVLKEVSRIKVFVANNENDGTEDGASLEPMTEHHHGRCDIGSPWARGCAFDVLEDDLEENS